MSARISLRGLFAVVGFAAFATAVLLRPSFFVASAVWSLTLLILGAAVVAAVCSSGKTRAFWAGFAFFGCAHMMLALGPWFADYTGRFIVTRQILDMLGRALNYDVRELTVNPRFWHNLGWSSDAPATDGYGYYNFLIPGQSFFSLVIGCLGGLMGQFFFVRRSTA
jgi:hypothetical protein